ncbi:vacuolar membrane-associated protein iml1 [Apophysomyces ossiformis]|uniref:Vacuolar membrane-associated protein IML1 n=1 Tax=Apophysomyces ossiformis TaxID=679940 RepID=A0A8H7BMY1_9FUNG|nr:vacuolar membrane-associated protein iml1 [Apophysomyces ossiformis]
MEDNRSIQALEISDLDQRRVGRTPGIVSTHAFLNKVSGIQADITALSSNINRLLDIQTVILESQHGTEADHKIAAQRLMSGLCLTIKAIHYTVHNIKPSKTDSNLSLRKIAYQDTGVLLLDVIGRLRLLLVKFNRHDARVESHYPGMANAESSEVDQDDAARSMTRTARELLGLCYEIERMVELSNHTILEMEAEEAASKPTKETRVKRWCFTYFYMMVSGLVAEKIGKKASTEILGNSRLRVMPALPATTNASSGQLLSAKPVILWFHDPGTMFNHDAVVNPDYFPNVQDGQVLRIHYPRAASQQQQQQLPTTTERESFVVKVTCVDRETLARQQQLQISISKDIAERFNLRFRPEVYVELIDPSAVALDHVELSFKDQYLGRSDMWRLQQSLSGTCVYVEKKILFAGVIKATVKKLWTDDREVTSGYINGSTRMIFRSGSAKYFVFIQMSREMWEFDEDGELYFEKVVNNFLPNLFNRWKDQGTNHVVSIVLFTRVFYDADDLPDELINVGEDGRRYKDFYKVIADWETTDDWMSVIGPLKEEHLKFQQSVLMRTEQDRSLVCGQIGMAYEGNILEAINLALNPFDKHYVDRDLMRTGLSIILVTPGAGKFMVSKKLLRLTNERMTDNGIAMDLVCLSPLPLHITPLLYYMSSPPPEELHDNLTTPRHPKQMMLGNSPDLKPGGGNNYVPVGAKVAAGYWDPLYQDDSSAATYQYYSVPHWIDCNFYHHETGRFIKQDKYKTRCKMYELQMMGIMEHDITGIYIPYLEDGRQAPTKTIKQQRSSSSLNDKLTTKNDEYAQHPNGNEETYLSRSANFPSGRRPSFFAAMENPPTKVSALSLNHEKYDGLLFKDSLEPRFNRRSSTQTSKISTNNKPASTGIQRASLDSPEQEQPRHGGNKSTTTWHHGDHRRLTSIISQSQQAMGKITFENNVKKDDHLPKASDIFKGSPTYPNREDRFRSSRRGTVTSTDVKFAVHIATDTGNTTVCEDDDSVVVSSSTVEPVPINNKGPGRMDNRKPPNHSPRQTIVSGSLPSIHKHSGNSDLVRTSFGATGPGNRSSPSHNLAARSSTKHMLINPCNPHDHATLFTSHLRRWLHALPKVEQREVPVVYWKSLSTPACLPLTTDYFPSNEELKMFYNHYMYTVSASEDANLYQAGDRSLSEHKKTANLLTEMLSQRLAQGFQIIVDITNSANYQKPKVTDVSSGLGLGNKDSTLTGSGSAGGIGPLTGTVTATTTPVPAVNTAGTGAVGGGIKTIGGLGSLQDEMDKLKWKHMVWWLSMGHQVHQLTFDSSGQNVEVRRYVRIIDFDTQKIGYKCAIWPKHLPSYRPKNVLFSYPSLLYAWNYLDHLVAGHQEELTDNLRFWRSRFIIVPREHLPSNIPMPASHEHLDEEEKRLALFDTWLQNIRKSKWLSPQEHDEMQNRRKKELVTSDFGVKFTTMDPSGYLVNEVSKLAHGERLVSQHSSSLLLSIGNLGPMALSRDSKSKDIALAMRDVKNGVKIQDRRWHFKIFRNAFIGNEFVDWLISQFDDINTREEAVAFGNALMARRPPLFVSSTGRHGFLDGHYFYKLHDEFIPGQHKAWFMNNSGTSRKQSASSTATGSPGVNGKDKDGSISGNGTATATTASSGILSAADTPSGRAIETVEFPMSKSMIIDVDPYKKSDRRETAILHYDTLHNPKNSYHFQVNWLGCTAQLVQELLLNWSRQAERCGLKLVEGSVEQAYEGSENNNPFQCPVPIELALSPPPVTDLRVRYDVPEQFYEIALVRHLGFVLDVEADSNFERARGEGVEVTYSYIKEPYKYDQYIHRSGVAFVQIRSEGKGFFWVNNRLYTSHTPALVARRRTAESSTLMHPEFLRAKFQEYCGNPVWLAEFWETTRSHLLYPGGDDPRQEAVGSWVLENTRSIEDLVDTEDHPQQTPLATPLPAEDPSSNDKPAATATTTNPVTPPPSSSSSSSLPNNNISTTPQHFMHGANNAP